MADPKPTPAAKPAPAKPAPAKPAAAAAGAKQSTAVAVPEGEAPKESRLGWILGWIVLPGTVVGGIFGGGVLLGAHNHDGWFASAVMWFVNLF